MRNIQYRQLLTRSHYTGVYPSVYLESRQVHLSVFVQLWQLLRQFRLYLAILYIERKLDTVHPPELLCPKGCDEFLPVEALKKVLGRRKEASVYGELYCAHAEGPKSLQERDGWLAFVGRVDRNVNVA